ncbi:Uncharacterised protein [Corynebacterium kutscheri]|uniref:Uncharacterized protein n=1 Tax=Corynebacterium kutscheri TaxID=35755 RepID=A0AB38VPV5_9CORY|nr:hypothetical protein [Corynebacterium kutscheri]VEH05426.1 Uncharacterised protein [Corynebacterium kutscheri]VEH80792.1 Uncharacterised protein [Corynebacterium kutscheri]
MLIIHYIACVILGIYGLNIFSNDFLWFIVALIFGPIFGLLGFFSQKIPKIELIIPLLFIAEPFLRGYLPARTDLPWPTYLADLIASVLLIIIGLVLAIVFLRKNKRQA